MLSGVVFASVLGMAPMHNGVFLSALSGLLTLTAMPNLVVAGPTEPALRTATDHYAHRRWDEAADAFRFFLTLAPHDAMQPRARFYLAESLMQLGQFFEAKKEFQTVLREASHPRYAPRALFRCGEIDSLMGAYDEALGAFEQFDSSYPDDPLHPFALVHLGQLHLREGKLAAARQAYQEALAQATSDLLRDQCRFGLAMVLEREGNVEQALEAFRRVAKADSPAVAQQACFRCGIVLASLDRHAEALDVWQDFARRYPGSSLQPRVDLARAESLLRLGRHAEARTLLERCTDDPRFGTDAGYWLGCIEEETGNWKAAGQRFAKAANRAPHNHPRLPALRYHAGTNLLKVGNAQEALAQFKLGRQTADGRSGEPPVEKRQPTDPRPDAGSEWSDDLLVGVMRASLALGRWDDVQRAIDTFQHEYSDSSLAAEVELMHAALLIAHRQYEKAMERLQAWPHTDDLGDLTPYWQAELAIASAQLGRYDQARRAAATLVDNGPPTEPGLREAIGQLAAVAFSGGQFSWAAELDALVGNAQAVRTPAAGPGGSPCDAALAGLAWCQICLDQREPARETFAKLASAATRATANERARRNEHLLRYGQQLEQMGMEFEASAGYRMIATQFDDASLVGAALLGEADLLARHGRYQEARQRYLRIERMTKPGPPEIDLLDRIAGTWQATGSIEQAASYWERIRSGGDRTGLHWVEATYSLAKRARDAGHAERATQLVSELTTIVDAPDDYPASTVAGALFFLGRLAADRRNWDDVAVTMKRLIDHFPRDEHCLRAEFWVAESRFRKGDVGAAIARLRSILPRVGRQADPWYGTVPLRYAQLLAHTGQWSKAREVARGIPAAYPGFSRQAEVDYLLGRCYAAEGRFDQARSWYEKATHSPGESPSETAAMAQWMIGETYLHQEKYAQARREYLRTEVVYTDYPQWQARGLLQAGKCLENERQWRDAARLYARILKEYGTTTSAHDATERLQAAYRHVKRPALVRSE